MAPALGVQHTDDSNLVPVSSCVAKYRICIANSCVNTGISAFSSCTPLTRCINVRADTSLLEIHAQRHIRRNERLGRDGRERWLEMFVLACKTVANHVLIGNT